MNHKRGWGNLALITTLVFAYLGRRGGRVPVPDLDIRGVEVSRLLDGWHGTEAVLWNWDARGESFFLHSVWKPHERMGEGKLLIE